MPKRAKLATTVPKKHQNDIHNQEDPEIEIKSISIHCNPCLSTKYLFILLFNFIKSFFLFLYYHKILIGSLTIAVISFFYAPGPHEQMRPQVIQIGKFALWWIGLGVASSIGLGTGLHTFVLYLGPHIAQVTMAANQCGFVPQSLPSKWNFELFKACDTKISGKLSFWDIFWSVELEAFLWGLGTAIGELPPYFVARAKRLSGRKENEIEDINAPGFINYIKRKIYSGLQNHAFLVVLLCASIPNPLFDLAGVTCGYFLIPFHVFFISTSFGKAVIKVSIQVFVIIFIFSEQYVNKFLLFLRNNFPTAQQFFMKELNKQKSKLFGDQTGNQEQSILAKIWSYVILLMILFFVYSILNSLINQEYEKSQKSKLVVQGDKKKPKKRAKTTVA